MCHYVCVCIQTKRKRCSGGNATTEGEAEATYDAVVVGAPPPPPTGRVLRAGELASCPVGDSGIVASPGSWLTSEVMAAAAIFERDRDR